MFRVQEKCQSRAYVPGFWVEGFEIFLDMLVLRGGTVSGKQMEVLRGSTPPLTLQRQGT